MGGGGSSQYSCAASEGACGRPRPSWLCDPASKLAPLKADSFADGPAIGKGKFGLVFLSKNKAQGKHVAIKYISKAYINETQCLTRLNQEIAVLQVVDHPFIIHCFGGFETEKCVAMVFEYAHGGELFTLMKKRNKMPEQWAKFYFSETALALSYLHDKLGILYRDLKPENILLDYDGHVKLCDFGFAVSHSNEDDPLHDGCGTAMYVAPEIAGGFMKCAHSFPVDWWSLGCVLSEMVSGYPPFGDTDSSSKFEIFNNINGQAPKISRGVSAALKALLRGLLDKDPKTRLAWKGVREEAWLSDVRWEAFMARAVSPPWAPNLPAEGPSTVNFVSWPELRLPSKALDSAAAAYCRGVELPKPRTSRTSAGVREKEKDSSVGGAPSSSSLSSASASASASGRGALLSDTPRVTRSKRGKSGGGRGGVMEAESKRPSSPLTL